MLALRLQRGHLLRSFPRAIEPHKCTNEGRRVIPYGPERHCDRMQTHAVDWIDHIRLARQLMSPGERYSFFASIARGELIALFRGVYIRASLWNTLSSERRYRARVTAAGRARCSSDTRSGSLANGPRSTSSPSQRSRGRLRTWRRARLLRPVSRLRTLLFAERRIRRPRCRVLRSCGKTSFVNSTGGFDTRHSEGEKGDRVCRREIRSTGRVGAPREYGVFGNLDAAITGRFKGGERSGVCRRLLVARIQHDRRV
jgi:hypothetical protein